MYTEPSRNLATGTLCVLSMYTACSISSPAPSLIQSGVTWGPINNRH